MSKIYLALEKAKQDKGVSENIDLVPVIEDVRGASDDLVVLKDPDSPMSESFRFLRSKVTRPAAGNPPRTILVTSALTGEGKTFVACNLAVSISQSLDEHVLLIDADLRDPSVHKVFGLRGCKEGLSSVLASHAGLPALLRKTYVHKLTILPAGNTSKAPSELLSSERMRRLIRETKDRYADRFVIVDSPPLELTPEASVIANEVDAVILVVRHGNTPRDAVKAALGKIQREKLLGVVYNGYDEPVKKYGYQQYGYGEGES